MKSIVKYKQVVNPIDTITIELTLEEAKMLKCLVGNFIGFCDIREKLISPIWDELCKHLPNFGMDNTEYRKMVEDNNGLKLQWSKWSK